MNAKGLVALAAATACTIALDVTAPTTGAQTARSFTWYGELVSVDQVAKTITVRAKIRDAVTRYVSDYKPGDQLMLTWVPVKGETDTVIYAPKVEVMKGIDQGYIFPAEFVSADAAGKTLTFKTAFPDALLQAVRSVQPGRWIQATVPMQQPGAVAAISTMASSEKPNIVVPPPAPAPPANEGGRGRGRGRANAQVQMPAALAAPGLAGSWVISASLGGNAIDTTCMFEVDGTKVGGSCSSELGDTEVSGEVRGNQVKFGYQVDFNGAPLALAYAGALETSGKAMKGTLSVFGMSSDFTATKQ
jgi:hypothetical protein